MTIGTTGVPSTTTVSISGPGAKNQSTGTTAPIYPDFYLPDTLDISLKQISWQISAGYQQMEIQWL